MHNLKSFWNNTARPHLAYAKASLDYTVLNSFYGGNEHDTKLEAKALPFFTSIILAAAAVTTGAYHIGADNRQDRVLEDYRWNNADAAEAKTANADRTKIKDQITTIKALEKQLANPEALGIKDQENLAQRLKTLKYNTSDAIIHNRSLPEKELANYAMSFDFQMTPTEIEINEKLQDGGTSHRTEYLSEKPSSPEVFKALREIQYNSGHYTASAGSESPVNQKFQGLVKTYNEAVPGTLTIFWAFTSLSALGFGYASKRIPDYKDKKPKPNLRDFKPKIN